MEEITTIKIAPDMDEIIVDGNNVRTEFNGMDIRFSLHENIYKDGYLKQCLQQGIALVSKTYQLKELLKNHFGNNFKDFSATEII